VLLFSGETPEVEEPGGISVTYSGWLGVRPFRFTTAPAVSREASPMALKMILIGVLVQPHFIAERL
jgi:hypothetical protein